MSRNTDKGLEAAALWARAREGWRETVAGRQAPDALTLASYLEGNLGPEAQARVEAWMASAPEALDQVVAARAALAEPVAEPVPESLLARAGGLVRARRAGGGFGAWLRELAGFRMAAWRPVAWAGVASVMLVVTFGSFELGRQGTVEILEVQTAAIDEPEVGLEFADFAEDLL